MQQHQPPPNADMQGLPQVTTSSSSSSSEFATPSRAPKDVHEHETTSPSPSEVGGPGPTARALATNYAQFSIPTPSSSTLDPSKPGRAAKLYADFIQKLQTRKPSTAWEAFQEVAPYRQVLKRFDRALDTGLLLDTLLKSPKEERIPKIAAVLDAFLAAGQKLTKHEYFRLAKAHADGMDWKTATTLLNCMEDAGVVPDQLVMTTILSNLAKNGHAEKCMALLGKLKRDGMRRDVSMYNAVIAGLVKKGDVGAASKVYEEMEKDKKTVPKPNVATFTHLITGYIGQGDMTHARMILTSMESRPEPLIPDSALAAVVVDGYVWRRDMETARAMFDKFESQGVKHNMKAYVNLMLGYAREGNVHECQALMTRFKSSGKEPSLQLYEHYASAFAKARYLEGILGALDEAESAGLTPQTANFNHLLDLWFRSGGGLPGSIALYEAIRSRGLEPDAVSYSRIMRAYAAAGNSAAVSRLMKEVETKGITVSAHHYRAVIYAYASNTADPKGGMEKALQEVKKMVEAGLKPDSVVFKVIIGGFKRAGDMESAEMWFSKMGAAGFKVEGGLEAIDIKRDGRDARDEAPQQRVIV
ncbi:hypothetical protein HK104_008042 [Borealophlyctis nickersoniae]|nr:hypothetical protein HK104_008042 [Borealophlyctis nickersoniae]